ncbi:hypothetical protein ACOKM3_23180 [Streptomyces sp. BH106]
MAAPLDLGAGWLTTAFLSVLSTWAVSLGFLVQGAPSREDDAGTS